MSEETEVKPEVQTFTAEQVEEIKAAAIEEATAGLKANNQKLLSEKKARQEREAQALEEAQQAREEAARKSGSIQEIEKTLQEKMQRAREEWESKLKKRDEIILGERSQSAINDLSALFKEESRGIGKTILSNMVQTEYNDEGQPYTKFSYNGQTTTDLSTFKEVLLSDDGLKPMLAGVQMSGGGAAGSGSNVAEAANQLEAKIKEAKGRAEKTGDLSEYLKLSQQR